MDVESWRSWRSHRLWAELPRSVPACRDLRGQDPEGRQARRSARRAAHEVRAGHQPQDRQGPRPHDPAVAAGAGGSGDRVMDRRRFLLTSLAGALAAPLAAEAQQAGKVSRIGCLALSRSRPSRMRRCVPAGLARARLRRGQNIVVEYAVRGGGNLDAAPELAAELVRLKVDVIVAARNRRRSGRQEGDDDDPHRHGRRADPVGTGFVASLARPGGNITGIADARPGARREAAGAPQGGRPERLARRRAAEPGTHPGRSWSNDLSRPPRRSSGCSFKSIEVRRRRTICDACLRSSRPQRGWRRSSSARH